MGLRIRKTINLGNGMKLNISNSGTSITVGTRGNTTTFAKDGVYKNVSTPGTGISYRTRIIKNSDIDKLKNKKTIVVGGTNMKKYKIYTDGGFCNTQSRGIGSWAFIILQNPDVNNDTKEAYKELKKDSGRQFDTTNNKMELQAVLEAMKALNSYKPDEDDHIEIISDSMYVIKGSTEWVNKWKENNWKTLTGKDVKNQDLWMKILKIKETYPNISFTWVKGHDSDKYNIECDALCQARIREAVEEIQSDTSTIMK
ncbi:hypothetical protein DLH72_04865 [Candidatus Gracilibacteria bacterium]|nr:MAG: hypothetical protein DLH72_04865 [Candidatus Gracilibacteria bacterium]